MKNSAVSFQGSLKEGIAFAAQVNSANGSLKMKATLTSRQPAGATFINALELRNVTIRYGDKLVLDNVNWTVKRNEKWALLGKNGSGNRRC